MSTITLDQAPDTPMMRQYLEIKRKYKEEIVFFRMGDFYEMFLDDAVIASQILDIALTQRQDKIPMCGIPYHAKNSYIHKILESGRNIAICEQIEDPKSVTGRIVKRDVVRILTPGTIFEEELLAAGDVRRLAFMKKNKEKNFVIATADLSGGQVHLSSCIGENIAGHLSSLFIVEIVAQPDILDEVLIPEGIRKVPRNYQTHNLDQLEKQVSVIFRMQNITALELSGTETECLSSLFNYIHEITPGINIAWQRPARENPGRIMMLDDTALRTLEVITAGEPGSKSSLFGVIDFTKTSAGKRLLASTLARPLMDIIEIESRLETVTFFQKKIAIREQLRNILKKSGDLERIVQSLSTTPMVRHLGSVLYTLDSIVEICRLLDDEPNIPQALNYFKVPAGNFPEKLHETLKNALYTENLPPILDERRFVKQGYSTTLDELFHLSENAVSVLQKFEEKEKAKYGIPTLKVRYNNVIGYFIEISKGQTGKAPTAYQRRQTLTNAERYTCPELKEIENSVLHAKDEVLTVQKGIFLTLVNETLDSAHQLQEWASILSLTDMLQSFAECAFMRRYNKPEITRGHELKLIDSRHAVVEAMFETEVFIPNDVYLSNESTHLAILTGPNMAGKSTYIRQIGLIQILAQCGSFVPASQAIIPITDRIFTRIGAQDRLSKGESTFYVEMAECARVFHNFTDKSLILLDEVGRGTSTFDGISIARAMIEFLNDKEYGRPKTLFATHYSELTQLIDEHEGITGLTVDVLEQDGKITFLRKIKKGTADKSYGVYVAGMAGLPEAIIERANVLLKHYEKGLIPAPAPVKTANENKRASATPDALHKQMGLF